MVLSGQHLFRMEIHRLSLMDLWQTYVLLTCPDPLLITLRILSGLWEEHPLVSQLLMLYRKTNLWCFAALQSFKTSKLCVRQD